MLVGQVIPSQLVPEVPDEQTEEQGFTLRPRLTEPLGGHSSPQSCRPPSDSDLVGRTGRRAVTPGLRDDDPLRAGPCCRQEVSAGLWDLHTTGRWCTGQSPCPVALSRLQCQSGLPQAGSGPRQLCTHLASTGLSVVVSQPRNAGRRPGVLALRHGRAPRMCLVER